MAVSLTVALAANFALHVSSQVVMPAGLLETRPPALSTSTVSVCAATKLAFTLRAAVMATVHAPVPEQAPDQAPKTPAGPPWGTSVTDVPLGNVRDAR